MVSGWGDLECGVSCFADSVSEGRKYWPGCPVPTFGEALPIEAITPAVGMNRVELELVKGR